MVGPDLKNALDHVVVVMFENRSFDNLLGRLYQPGEVPSFEGVIGKDLSNPIPEWVEHGAGGGPIPYGIAKDMNTPTTDPGEEYQHVNTQLFGQINPTSNRGVLAPQMISPYNAPADTSQPPPMSGFVTDFISAFTAEMGRQPTYDEYAQIMAGYTPEQVPVLSTLARGFGTFDHWFAAVPSQTFTNRSFFHAATASGFVVNSPYGNFPVHNTAETIFDRLDAAGLTWRVYCDPPSSITFTGLIHASRLRDRFATHFLTTDQFYEDAANGDLPTYSFIEPNLRHGHNDMQPPISALMPGMSYDSPSSILGGEALLAKIYTAIRSSESATESNCYNTLFMVVFGRARRTVDRQGRRIRRHRAAADPGRPATTRGLAGRRPAPGPGNHRPAGAPGPDADPAGAGQPRRFPRAGQTTRQTRPGRQGPGERHRRPGPGHGLRGRRRNVPPPATQTRGESLIRTL